MGESPPVVFRRKRGEKAVPTTTRSRARGPRPRPPSLLARRPLIPSPPAGRASSFPSAAAPISPVAVDAARVDEAAPPTLVAAAASQDPFEFPCVAPAPESLFDRAPTPALAFPPEWTAAAVAPAADRRAARSAAFVAAGRRERERAGRRPRGGVFRSGLAVPGTATGAKGWLAGGALRISWADGPPAAPVAVRRRPGVADTAAAAAAAVAAAAAAAAATATPAIVRRASATARSPGGEPGRAPPPTPVGGTPRAGAAPADPGLPAALAAAAGELVPCAAAPSLSPPSAGGRPPAAGGGVAGPRAALASASGAPRRSAAVRPRHRPATASPTDGGDPRLRAILAVRPEKGDGGASTAPSPLARTAATDRGGGGGTARRRAPPLSRPPPLVAPPASSCSASMSELGTGRGGGAGSGGWSGAATGASPVPSR